MNPEHKSREGRKSPVPPERHLQITLVLASGSHLPSLPTGPEPIFPFLTLCVIFPSPVAHEFRGLGGYRSPIHRQARLLYPPTTHIVDGGRS